MMSTKKTAIQVDEENMEITDLRKRDELKKLTLLHVQLYLEGTVNYA